MTPPVLPALIFDLDGTLIDSAPDIHAAVNLMLKRKAQSPLSLAEVTSFVGNGLPKLVERVMRASGMDLSDHDEVTDEVLADYDSVNGQLTRPYPGVSEALAAFDAAGCPMAICTNKPESPARHILGKLGLLDFFPVVIGGDSLSVRKPDPRPLFAAIDVLGGQRGNALYVGDSEVDAETAVAADIPFALFTRGYRKTPAEEIPHLYRFDEFSDFHSIAVRHAESG